MKKDVQQLTNVITSWQSDFPKFCKEAVGIGNCECECVLDPAQVKLGNSMVMLVMSKWRRKLKIDLKEVEQEIVNKMGISVDSGRGGGKTSWVALAILWFLTCFRDSKVLCTAPKKELLKDNLWGEISKWIRHSEKVYGEGSILKALFVLQADKIFVKSENKESWGKEWYALARTCNRNASPEDQKATLSGYHGEFLMIIVDESYGVPDLVYEPIDKTLTQAVNLCVLIGNPTKNYGYASDTSGKNSQFWINHRINVEESSLVTKEFIERQIISCGGRDTNLYRVNILGLKPLSESDALFPYEWIVEAEERWEDFKGYNTAIDVTPIRVYGCDIGGGGDDSVICLRENDYIHPFRSYNNPDTMLTSSWIEKNAIEDDPQWIFVDSVGIGQGVLDDLRRYGHNVLGVKVGNKSTHPQRYKFLRDELFWRLRLWFEMGRAMIPPDDDLRRELSMLKLEDPDSTLIKVSSKKKMRKETEHYSSPNKADSLALAFYLQDETMQRKIKRKDMYETKRYNQSVSYTWMSA